MREVVFEGDVLALNSQIFSTPRNFVLVSKADLNLEIPGVILFSELQDVSTFKIVKGSESLFEDQIIETDVIYLIPSAYPPYMKFEIDSLDLGFQVELLFEYPGPVVGIGLGDLI